MANTSYLLTVENNKYLVYDKTYNSKIQLMVNVVGIPVVIITEVVNNKTFHRNWNSF